ncbi:MAG TPA: hypothetical protein VGF77_14180 [Allosphingosinicella sp.]
MGRALYLGLFTGALALAPTAGQAASPPPVQPDPVASFGCKADREAPRQDLQAIASAYGQRSVAIVRAALARNMNALGRMVAPSASFTLFRGDVGIASRRTGSDAAVEFVGGIGPEAFQYSTAPTMPSLADPCGEAAADVMLTGRQPGEAVLATFKYRAGLLAEVDARHIDVTRGDFAPAADDK